MAVTASELQVILKAKDEMSKVLKNASGSVGTLTKGFSSLGGSADSTFKAMISSAGKLVGVVGLAGVAAGIVKVTKEAAGMQTVAEAFRATADNADLMLQSLRQGSAGMIKNAELMRNYNEATQLVGKAFADQLPNAMKYLMKVSASTGKSMDYLMSSITTGVGRLSPMILDNLGIQVSLEEATQRATEMFGKESDALSKTEKQAGMTAVVMEKLEKNTAGLPEATGKAATEMASFGTTLQNAAMELGTAFVPALQEVLGILTPLAGKLEAAFASEKFQSSIKGMADGVGKFLDYLFTLNPTLVKTVAGMGALLVIVPKVISAYVALGVKITALKSMFETLAIAMMVNPIILVAAGIVAAGVAIALVVKSIKDNTRSLAATAQAIAPAVETYAEYTARMVEAARETGNYGMLTRDADVAQSLLANDVLLTEEAFNRYRTSVENVGPALEGLNEGMLSGTAIWKAQRDAAQEGSDGVVAALDASSRGMSAYSARMTGLANEFKTKVVKAMASIADAVGPALEQWYSTVEGHQKSLEDAQKDHQASLADLSFEFRGQQIKDYAEYAAERQSLMDRGATEEVAALDEKYAVQQANADQSYAEQQSRLEIALAGRQVTQTEAYLADLQAQDTALRLKVATQVLESALGEAHQKELLGILEQGAQEQYEAKLENVKKMLKLDEDLRTGEVEGAKITLEAMLAAQAGVMKGVTDNLAKLKANYAGLQADLLGKMGNTTFYSGAANAAAKAIGSAGTKMKESATKTFSEVAREIDSGVSAIANAIKNAATVLWTPSVEKGFDNVGEALKAGVGKVYDWLEDPDANVKNKINKIKEFLEPIQQLFEILSTDLSRIMPATPKGGFTAAAEAYFSQLAETLTLITDWISTIGEDARAALPKAAEVAGYITALFSLLGVDLAGIVPEGGAFAERVASYLRQLQHVSGSIYDWMVLIPEQTRASVALAAVIAQDVRALFDLLGVDLTKIVPATGAFAAAVDRYLRQLQHVSGSIYDWMMSIPEQTRESVTLAALIAQDIRALFDILGVDLTKIVPAVGAFAAAVDLYLRQLQHVSGSIYDWMMSIPKKLRDSVAQAGELAGHVKKLFDILGVDLTEIVPAGGAFAEAVDRYLRQLQHVSGSIYNWMMLIPKKLRGSVAKAAELAGYVGALFQLLEVDLTKIIPAEGAFSKNLARYIQQLKHASGSVYDWMMEISVEARKNLEEASTMAGYVKQLFDLLNVDLAKIVPAGPTFSVRLDGYLRGLKEATKKIGEWIRADIIPMFTEMREGIATNLLPEIAATADDLSSVLNLLTFSDVFKAIRDNTSTVDMGGLVGNYMATLRKVVERMMVGPDSLPQLKADYGDALAEVKDVAALIADIIGYFATIATDLESARSSGWIDLGTVSLLMRQLYLTGQILSNNGAPIGYVAPEQLGGRWVDNPARQTRGESEEPVINFSLTLPIIVNIPGVGRRSYVVARAEAVRAGVAILDAVEVG